ncbi:MAG: TrbI/VirB10 family protein [Acidimicrobiales bacterium]
MTESPEGAPESGGLPGAAKKESAAALELRVRPRPVTRLNRKMLAGILAIFAIAVLIAAMVGLRRPSSRSSVEPTQATAPTQVAHAQGLAAMPHSYAGVRTVPQLGAPAGEFGPAVVKEERAAGIPELPERPSFMPNPAEDEIRAERLQEQREAQEAAKAQLFVHLTEQPTAMTGTAATGAAAQSPSLAAAEAIASHVGEGLNREGAVPANAGAAQSAQAQKASFLGGQADAQIYATGQLETPRSPFELLAGTVIPAALVTGIDSELPGNIIATVTENVYDTVTGRILLIPQGSRLLGVYDSQVAYGQSRVLLVWTRLILPDGSSIILDRLPGTDTEGYSGLTDQVDWHWNRLVAGAAVSTLLGAAAELAVPSQFGGSQSVVYASLQGLQGTMNQVGQEITRRNLDIQPTITIRPGYPVRVIVNKDLVLHPYPSNDNFSSP